MKTLKDRHDLWIAYKKLGVQVPVGYLLDGIYNYFGDDKMRSFVDRSIRDWDMEYLFRDYTEFAEEESK